VSDQRRQLVNFAPDEPQRLYQAPHVQFRSACTSHGHTNCANRRFSNSAGGASSVVAARPAEFPPKELLVDFDHISRWARRGAKVARRHLRPKLTDVDGGKAHLVKRLANVRVQIKVALLARQNSFDRRMSTGRLRRLHPRNRRAQTVGRNVGYHPNFPASRGEQFTLFSQPTRRQHAPRCQ
jgi:hypothetical protein